jgi:hypothetical protein
MARPGASDEFNAKGGFDCRQSGLLRRAELEAIRTKNGVKKVGIFTPTPL